MTLRQKRITKKVVIYIVLVIMTIASLFPIFFCLSASLRTQEDLFQNMFPFTIRSLIPTNITGENYSIIFTKYEFWRPIMNTMIVTVVLIIFLFLIKYMEWFWF